jgi:hypothetical protein
MLGKKNNFMRKEALTSCEVISNILFTAEDKIEDKIPVRMHSFFKQLEDRNLSPHYQSTTISSGSASQGTS